MTQPLLTVAIPTYNRARWLRRCLGSVLACDRADIEILVSDNASTDGTGAMREQFMDQRLRWLTQPSNLGMAANWQFLLDRARGTWFLLLSDDDMVEPRALTLVLEALATIPGNIVVTGLVIENHITGREFVRVPQAGVHVGRDFIIGSMTGEHVALPSAMLLRSEALRGVGGYAPRPYRLAVDAAAWFELAAVGQVTVLPDLLCRYAVQPTSLTSSDDAMMGEVEKLYGEWIHRLQPTSAQIAQIRRILEGSPTAFACRRIASAPCWRRPILGLKALMDGRKRSMMGAVRHAIMITVPSLGLMWLANMIRGHRRIGEASRGQSTAPHPLLTVITVVRNGESTIRRCVESVRELRAALSATATIVHIIKDGGSTDGTLSIIRDMGLGPEDILNCQADQGIYDAMNQAVALARDGYVLFINCDDQAYVPGLRNFLQNKLLGDHDVHLGSWISRKADGSRARIFRPSLGGVLSTVRVCHQATIYRRQVFERFGMYDPSFSLSGDFEYYVRLKRRGASIAIVPEVLCEFREGGRSMSNPRVALKEAATAYRRYFPWWRTGYQRVRWHIHLLRVSMIEKVNGKSP